MANLVTNRLSVDLKMTRNLKSIAEFMANALTLRRSAMETREKETIMQIIIGNGLILMKILMKSSQCACYELA